ncbi:GntR family transcriptional regulator [Amycolatopsis acidicola]|uniref:GntR family transcriptional regulator n=1 Tax=Amycolatopsis acidicola TaxID=2596893 RepID=A0A5N0VH93_9PSEU|nr:GntR family transcriptional regulator [Amycolatopsis acidicola]KAA9164042.1 GntR family transcriptional regulator [Amycolatopsis acidicola]
MTVQPASQLQRYESLREQALAVIRKGLLVGEIKPGEIYSAAGLAATLGVSNSPVREAMLTLVQQGLMEPVRNRGYRVIPVSDKDLVDIYQVRVMLEAPAMRQLAQTGKVSPRASEFGALADDIVRGARQEDLVLYIDADRQFHLGLLAMLGNDHLTSIVENLRDKTPQRGLSELIRQGRLIESAEEHRPILDALVAGNGEKAEALMLAHLSHIPGDWNKPAED